MKAALASFLIVTAALAFAPPAGAATFTYGGVPIVKGSDVDMRLATAREICLREASTPIRGTSNTQNFYHGVALKSCLYRLGFFGDGSQVYPVPLFGGPSDTR